jgi:hypothetical protein
MKAITVLGGTASDDKDEIRRDLRARISALVNQVQSPDSDKRNAATLEASSIAQYLTIIDKLENGTASWKDRLDFSLYYFKSLMTEITWERVAIVASVVAATACIFFTVGWFMSTVDYSPLTNLFKEDNAVLKPLEGPPGGEKDEKKEPTGASGLPARVPGEVPPTSGSGEEELDEREYFLPSDIHFFCLQKEHTPDNVVMMSFLPRMKSIFEWTARICELAARSHPESDCNRYLEGVMSIDLEDYDQTGEFLLFRQEVGDKGSKGQRIAAARSKRLNASYDGLSDNDKAAVRHLKDQRRACYKVINDIMDDFDGVNMNARDRKDYDDAYAKLDRMDLDIRNIYDGALYMDRGSRAKGGRKQMGNRFKRKQFGEISKIDFVEEAPRVLKAPVVLTPPNNPQPPPIVVAMQTPQAAPVAIAPATVRQNCPTCKKRHARGKCNKCGKVHCFKADCAGTLQMATSKKGIDVQTIQNGCMKITYRDSDLESVAWKVTYKGGTYLMCCTHQLECEPALNHGGVVYSLKGNAPKFLFKELDIALIPWAFFNGICPVVTSFPIMERLTAYSKISGQDAVMTFVHVEPSTKRLLVSGFVNWKFTDKLLMHDVSTGNGSCGSIVLIQCDGKFYVVSIHSGTMGAGDHPNYGYLFDPLN